MMVLIGGKKQQQVYIQHLNYFRKDSDESEPGSPYYSAVQRLQRFPDWNLKKKLLCFCFVVVFFSSFHHIMRGITSMAI